MRGKKLQSEIRRLIESNWPMHVKEIVRGLELEVTNSNIKKVGYHIKKLKENEKVRVKRIGKALVVWPMEMEKLRFIHEMLKE